MSDVSSIQCGSLSDPTEVIKFVGELLGEVKDDKRIQPESAVAIFDAITKHCFNNVINQASYGDGGMCPKVLQLLDVTLNRYRKLSHQFILEGSIEESAHPHTNTSVYEAPWGALDCRLLASGGTRCTNNIMDLLSAIEKGLWAYVVIVSKQERNLLLSVASVSDKFLACKLLLDALLLGFKLVISLDNFSVASEDKVMELAERLQAISIKLVEHALRALENLSLDMESRGCLGAKFDALSIVLKILKGFGKDHLTLSEQCILVLTNLTTGDYMNQMLFVDADGCELLLYVLKSYGSISASVADVGLFCLQHLMSESSGNSRIASMSASMVVDAPLAIISAAQRFEELGNTTSVVLQMLRAHGTASMTVAESGLGALLSVVQHSHRFMHQALEPQEQGDVVILRVFEAFGVVSAEVAYRGLYILGQMAQYLHRMHNLQSTTISNASFASVELNNVSVAHDFNASGMGPSPASHAKRSAYQLGNSASAPVITASSSSALDSHTHINGLGTRGDRSTGTGSNDAAGTGNDTALEMIKLERSSSVLVIEPYGFEEAGSLCSPAAGSVATTATAATATAAAPNPAAAAHSSNLERTASMRSIGGGIEFLNYWEKKKRLRGKTGFGSMRVPVEREGETSNPAPLWSASQTSGFGGSTWGEFGSSNIIALAGVEGVVGGGGMRAIDVEAAEGEPSLFLEECVAHDIVLEKEEEGEDDQHVTRQQSETAAKLKRRQLRSFELSDAAGSIIRSPVPIRPSSPPHTRSRPGSSKHSRPSSPSQRSRPPSSSPSRPGSSRLSRPSSSSPSRSIRGINGSRRVESESPALVAASAMANRVATALDVASPVKRLEYTGTTGTTGTTENSDHRGGEARERMSSNGGGSSKGNRAIIASNKATVVHKATTAAVPPTSLDSFYNDIKTVASIGCVDSDNDAIDRIGPERVTTGAALESGNIDGNGDGGGGGSKGIGRGGVVEEEDRVSMGLTAWHWALRLLERHGSLSIYVLQSALRLLIILTSYTAENWELIGLEGGCTAILRAIQGNEDLLEVEQATQHHDNGLQRMGMTSGHGSSVARKTIIETCELSFEVLASLAQSRVESRDELSSLQGYFRIAEILYAQAEVSVYLCELGLHAFILIFEKVRAAEANDGCALACHAVLKVLTVHGQYSDTVAEVGIWAVELLAMYHANKVVLGDGNACAIILNLMREHGMRNKTLARHGCAAIANLMIHDGNHLRLTKAGAPKVVCELIGRFGRLDEAFAEQGLRAVHALAMKNRALLGELGACELVLQLVRYYITDVDRENESIARLASQAIYNLCFQYKENKQRFLQLRALQELKLILNERWPSHPTRDEVKDAMKAIQFEH